MPLFFKRIETKSNHATEDARDISELFEDSGDEAEPEVETRAPRQIPVSLSLMSGLSLALLCLACGQP